MEESKEEIWVYKVPVQELIMKLGLKGKQIESIDDDDDDMIIIRTADVLQE